MLPLEWATKNDAREPSRALSVPTPPVVAGHRPGMRFGNTRPEAQLIRREREAKAWIKRDGLASWRQELVRRRAERNARTRARTAALVASRRAAP